MDSIRPTLHFVGLPHTQTTNEYVACAYTGKLMRLAPAMKTLGYKVNVYASEEFEGEIDELITIAPKSDQQRWFGNNDHTKNFFNLTWDPNDIHWRITNQRAIQEIRERIEPNDLICIIAGVCQQEIANAFPDHSTIEYGIGYSGVFSSFKVFESYAWMHWVYGQLNTDNGGFYDAVIPNYFNEDEFYATKEDAYTLFKGEHINIINKPEPYFVWMGRFINRKGPGIAVEATRRIGAKLIMAGQGVKNTYKDGNKTYLVGDDIVVSGSHIEHIGHVDVAQRAKLLANAQGCFMPTTYLEPFGGVSIESLMSGTPVLATDFGVFPENIPHGVVGYRYRTIGEAAYYASQVDKLDPVKIRKYAVDNFSVNRVKYLYDDYFQQVSGIRNGNDFYGPFHGRIDRYERFL